MSELIHKSKLNDVFNAILKDIQEVFEVTQTNFVRKEWLINKFKEKLK